MHARFGGRLFFMSRVVSVMRRLDAQHYWEEANRCREAAEYAQDERTKALLLVAESRWITLANQAELVAVLNVSPNHPE